MAHPCYRDPRWKIFRLVILRRDGWRCQIQRAGCLGTASQVDHIVRLADGGAWFDATNARASCKPCNIAEGNDARFKTRTAPPSRAW